MSTFPRHHPLIIGIDSATDDDKTGFAIFGAAHPGGIVILDVSAACEAFAPRQREAKQVVPSAVEFKDKKGAR